MGSEMCIRDSLTVGVGGSLEVLHSRSELKHQKSVFRRSENNGRPRSRVHKDRTRLATSCYSLRSRRGYRMRQFGLGEVTPSLPILAFPRYSGALWRRACGSACRGGKGRS